MPAAQGVQPAPQAQQLERRSAADAHAHSHTAEGAAATQHVLPASAAALQPEQWHPAFRQVHAGLQVQAEQHVPGLQPGTTTQQLAMPAQDSHVRQASAAPAQPVQSGQLAPHPVTPPRQQQALVQVHPLLPPLPEGQLVFTPPWKTSLAAPFQQCVQQDQSAKYMGPGVIDTQAACVVYDPSTHSFRALASAPLPGVHAGTAPAPPCGHCGQVTRPMWLCSHVSCMWPEHALPRMRGMHWLSLLHAYQTMLLVVQQSKPASEQITSLKWMSDFA